MAAHLGVRRCVLLLVLVVASAALGSGTAAAAGLDDYRWERRPLLVFAPTDADPRLTETLNRIEATRCAFEGRDMVLGRILTTGTSTLDGQAIDAGERQRLVARFGVGADDFARAVDRERRRREAALHRPAGPAGDLHGDRRYADAPARDAYGHRGVLIG